MLFSNRRRLLHNQHPATNKSGQILGLREFRAQSTSGDEQISGSKRGGSGKLFKDEGRRLKIGGGGGRSGGGGEPGFTVFGVFIPLCVIIDRQFSALDRKYMETKIAYHEAKMKVMIKERNKEMCKEMMVLRTQMEEGKTELDAKIKQLNETKMDKGTSWLEFFRNLFSY